jgi:hypothetical protein
MTGYGSILIDGRDGWSDFGILVLKDGWNDWISFPEMKPPFSHNWEDEDSIEVDLNKVFVKEKNVSLQILFIANSGERFWKNYGKLQDTLIAPGTRTVYIHEIGKIFEVYYSKCPEISKLTRLKNAGKTAVKLTLDFVMPSPLSEIFRALLFGTGGDMITENGNNVLIAI